MMYDETNQLRQCTAMRAYLERDPRLVEHDRWLLNHEYCHAVPSTESADNASAIVLFVVVSNYHQEQV